MILLQDAKTKSHVFHTYIIASKWRGNNGDARGKEGEGKGVIRGESREEK